jgi:hypothetical protein
MVDKFKSPWGTGCLVYGVVFVIVFLAVGGIGVLLPLPAKVSRPVIFLWLAGAVPGIVLLFQKKYFPWFSGLVGGLGCAALFFVVSSWLVTGPFFWFIALLVSPRKECPSCTKAISSKATNCPYCGSEMNPPSPSQVVEGKAQVKSN